MWALVVGWLAVCGGGGARALLCSEILEAPEGTRWTAGELRAAPARELVACLAHVAKEPLPLDVAQHVWRTLVRHYGGVADVPDEKLAQLRWVSVALEPEEYANLTLGDGDVVENFGRDYGLRPEQLAAIAERVRDDWGGKEPEDYTHHDLRALRQILCAFNGSEVGRVRAAAYREAAAALGRLRACPPEVLRALARLAVAERAFGAPARWDAATVQAVGAVAAGLPPDLARQLRHRARRHPTDISDGDGE